MDGGGACVPQAFPSTPVTIMRQWIKGGPKCDKENIVM